VFAQSRITGKERDAETGLDYFGARYNASTMGRFMSADPYEIVIRKNRGDSANQQKQLLESFIANPQAWNRYAYGLNNPIKNVDVGGNCSAPAGLQGGQTGVCVEAFIAAPRIGGVGLGDNRTFNSNGGTYRFRVDVRVDSGSTGAVSINKDVGFSKVGTESLNFGRRGTGDATLGPVTTDDNGNRHFEVTGTAQNVFEAINNLGTISFGLKFTATPDGTVTLDKATGTTFPSIEAYSYNSSGQVTGTLLRAPEHDSGDLKKPEQCLGGTECPK
jgi:RHS repeat-associated protein